MYVIKYIDKITNRIKDVKERFSTSHEASEYIDINMSKIKEVWIEEEFKAPKKNINLSDFVGSWAWVYSEKKKEFFSYGILRECKGTFVHVQTKENQSKEDFCFYRIERFKDMIANNKLILKQEGEFVSIKDFL